MEDDAPFVGLSALVQFPPAPGVGTTAQLRRKGLCELFLFPLAKKVRQAQTQLNKKREPD